MRVFHGAVSVLGCLIKPDGKWHEVISDPRKNMLIDIKNESQDEQVKDFVANIDDKLHIKVGDLSEKVALIGIKEFKKYSKAEEQFLIPSDQLHIKNMSTVIDQRKSFFSLN